MVAELVAGQGSDRYRPVSIQSFPTEVGIHGDQPDIHVSLKMNNLQNIGCCSEMMMGWNSLFMYCLEPLNDIWFAYMESILWYFILYVIHKYVYKKINLKKTHE